MKPMSKKLILFIVLIVIAGTGVYYWQQKNQLNNLIVKEKQTVTNTDLESNINTLRSSNDEIYKFDQAVRNKALAVIQTIDTPYNFPVKPGMKEWAVFNDHGEMLNALMIPPDILKKMSTNALIMTFLSYPLLGDMYAYNDIQKGFEAVTSGFNGLQELMIRKDASQKLFEKHIATDLEEYPEGLSFGLSTKAILRLALFQNDIFNKLSGEEKNSLDVQLLKNHYKETDCVQLVGETGRPNSDIIESRKQLCAEERAWFENNPNFCRFHSDPDQCYSWMAIKLKDPIWCNKPGVKKENCIKLVETTKNEDTWHFDYIRKNQNPI